MILIRADGSKLIGMGHISRACLIAEAFSSRGYDVRLLVKTNASVIEFLGSRGISPEFLPEQIELEAEFNLIEERLSCNGGVLIVDKLNHYDYSALFKKLRFNRCISAVIFDDSYAESIHADIAINGSPSCLIENYVGGACHYLVGPRYFIMDSKYKDIVISPPKKNIRDVFLTLGGSDHHDLIFKLLKAFDRFGDRYHITIASTSASGYLNRLTSTLKGVKFPVKLYLDQPTLLNFWGSSDVAITAGGNSLFERIASRLPGATLCQLDLQMKHAESFEELGVNMNLGYGPDLDCDSLYTKLDYFLNNQAEHIRQYENSSCLIGAKGLDYLIEAVEQSKQRLS